MKLNEGIVEVAKLFLGLGESGKNNQGFWVNLYRRAWKVYGGGEWCAHFASHCVELAYYGTNKKPPRIRARSVRKMLRLCKKHGKVVTDPQPGDLEFRNRPGPGMHVGIVETADNWEGYRTNIEGNVGRFPAKVKRIERNIRPDEDDAHVCFIRLRG